MSRILVFNPEHDYALSHGGEYYTSPASIKKLAKELQFIPIVWSEKEDYILLSDDSIIKASNHKEIYQGNFSFSEVLPWGWNPSLCRRLKNLGCPHSILPSSDTLNNLRRLSHRRISIKANVFLHSSSIPIEFGNVDDAMTFYNTFHKCYFKMPWSSGGRGVVATEELNAFQVKEWITGCIRRQGSVLAEKGIERVLDFGSLWDVNEQGAVFEGFSISLSDGRGKYGGNLFGPQQRIMDVIISKCSFWDDNLIVLQKQFIDSYIFPYYQGKLGIDMMIDRDGVIYPCVEINLRRTMGHVALDYYLSEQYESKYYWKRQCRISSLKSIREWRG